MTGRSWHKLLSPTAIFILAVVLIGGGLATFLVNAQRTIRDEAAMEFARGYASTLAQLQQFYTAEVLSQIDPDQIDVTHEYQQRQHAVPLPATLTIDFAEFVTRDTPGLRAALRSDHPFPWRSQQRMSAFEARALARLRTSDAAEVAEFTVGSQGQRFLHFAAPIRMAQACVDCHNSHPQSPKRDWKLGDVRGIHVIEAPVAVLGADITTRYGLLLLAVAGTAILAGTLIAMSRAREIAAQASLAARNEDLTKANAEKDAANRAKSEFLANISHEIRTPMNGILGLADLMQQDARTAEDRARVAQIQSAGTSLLRVINDVLDFATIEARKLDIERTAFSPEALAERATALFAHSERTAGPELLVELDHSLPPQISGDAFRITQVLTNLLGNALKFTDSGHVLLRIQRAPDNPDEILYEVEDTGIGIEADKIAGLFQPFAQADASDTRRHGGTGLGLAISRSLAEQMGGRLEVISAPGRGSRFGMTLPLVPVRGVPPANRKAPGALRRVVLYTDYVPTGDILQGILTHYGITVIPLAEAKGARAALELALAEADDVLLVAAVQAPVPAPLSALFAGTDPFAQRMVLIHARGQAADPLQANAMAAPVLPGQLIAKLAEVQEAARVGAAAPDPRDFARLGSATPDNALSGLHVLVVDDNDLNRIVTQGFLERSKATVRLAESGQQAVEMAKTDSFDVVLMDIQMPDMDGYETTRTLRAAGHSMPVIAVTAASQQSDLDRSVAEGLQGHLSKPLSRRVLIDALSDYLPGAKPRPGFRTSIPRKKDPPQDSLRAALETLGVDTERGLRLNGETEAAYAAALVRFAREDATLVDRFVAALAADDLREANRQVQKIKSVLFTVGADPLAKRARALSQILRSGETPDPAQSAKLRSDYAQIVAAILTHGAKG